MDSHSFLTYLKATRWSKLISIALAGVFFLIMAFYFMFLQSSYTQRVWEFKNFLWLSHSVTLKPGHIYEILWQNEYKTVPYIAKVNGKKAYVGNYVLMKYHLDKDLYYLDKLLDNPSHIRVDEETELDLSFYVRTPMSGSSNLGDLMSNWVEGLGDPLGIVNWRVVDMNYYKGPLTIDGKFPIYPIQKK